MDDDNDDDDALETSQVAVDLKQAGLKILPWHTSVKPYEIKL
jgi:hypothetical protein